MLLIEKKMPTVLMLLLFGLNEMDCDVGKFALLGLSSERANTFGKLPTIISGFTHLLEHDKGASSLNGKI